MFQTTQFAASNWVAEQELRDVINDMSTPTVTMDTFYQQYCMSISRGRSHYRAVFTRAAWVQQGLLHCQLQLGTLSQKFVTHLICIISGACLTSRGYI